MNKDKIKEICAINGASGYENAVAEYVVKELTPCVDECYIDVLGNVIGHKKGNGPKMMLAAHMDQIGFMATHIDEKGFIRFSTIGGFSPYNLISRRVKFENGTVGIMQKEGVKSMSEFDLDKLYIDIGARNKEEAEKFVKIGDVCVYAAEPYVDDIKVISPAIDNRMSCFILLETAKEVKNSPYDLYYVFTVQEEVGLKGAKTAAYAIDPDYGIAYDVTIAFDTIEARKLPMKIGEGACVKIKDSSVMCHPKIVKFLRGVADEHKIKYQLEILEGGGTDAGAISINKGGVPSGVISVALRYVHTDSEMCYLEDVQAAIDLSVKALQTEIK